jgi:hypothetical protein
MEMIIDIVELMLITGFFSFLIMMIILFIAIQIYKGEFMNKIPIVIEDRKSYEDIVLGLNAAMKEMQRVGMRVPKATSEAYSYALAKLEKYRLYNIMTLVDLLTDPGKRIVEKFLEAVEDGRINLKDLPQGISIIGAISDIVKLMPEAGKELKDLTWDEAEIIVVIIMRLVKDKQRKE